MMEALRLDDFHFSPQHIFEVREQATGEKRGSVWASLDQKIQIAVAARISASEGTEHLDAPDAVTPSNRKNRFTLAGEQFVDSHKDSANMLSQKPAGPDVTGWWSRHGAALAVQMVGAAAPGDRVAEEPRDPEREAEHIFKRQQRPVEARAQHHLRDE